MRAFLLPIDINATLRHIEVVKRYTIIEIVWNDMRVSN